MKFYFPLTRRFPLPVLLFLRLVFVALLMDLTRWIFYIFNASQFSDLHAIELIYLMLIGLRFDIAALAMVNAMYVIALAVPVPFKYNSIYIKVTDWFFMVSNALAIGLNLIDVVYFRYISKRTTAELFQFFGNANENIGGLMWQFLVDFWYMWLIWILIIWALFKFTKFFVVKSSAAVKTVSWYFWQGSFFLLSLSILIIAMRGGFQLKPISLVNAGKYTETKNIPLVINTPFSIIKTFNSQTLKENNYIEPEALTDLYNPVHQPSVPNRFFVVEPSKKNIVIIILESFGRELIQFYNPERKYSITPFLDSLFSQSLAFDGWANGRRSIEALPSIMAGIPSLMSVDYPSSPYAGNRIEGLGRLLQKRGYETAFFHGGNNGTMNFDAFAKAAGFEQYFGRNEYNNDIDFDGRWGIFDGPFLQFATTTMSKMQQPFATAVFTLSSHHPFTLPTGFEASFPQAENDFERSVAYSDHCLKDFFHKASKESWFNNTVFVIMADHTHPEVQSTFYKSPLGIYAIPIVFFMSGQQIQAKRVNECAQQTDMMPSLLSLTGNQEAFLSFGRNLFDSLTSEMHVSYLNQVYQFQNGKNLIQFNGESLTGYFSLATDSLLQNNLFQSNMPNSRQMELELKAIIQQYNNRMIFNKLTTRP